VLHDARLAVAQHVPLNEGEGAALGRARGRRHEENPERVA
jgi:hypothetical protein